MAEADAALSELPSAAFLDRFRALAGPSLRLRFDEFLRLALYHPQVGYYRKNRKRVGYGPGTDFFTASTSGPLFGELICAACSRLLSQVDLSTFTFVEIGAEPEANVLNNVVHPFGNVRILRLGEEIELSGQCVVFSNELFDAQPFRRFTRQNGVWMERAVELHGEQLQEITVGEVQGALREELPSSLPNGYTLDLPYAAKELASAIAAQPWTGLFLAFDYGKSWRELIEATPAGTARAYYRHTQSNNLLARPGEQDVTCHVCWDWLSEALRVHDFAAPQVQSQEAFFIHHAGDFIAATSAAEAARFSQRKLSLMQLLHPAHLGQKFQALHAVR